MNGLTTNTKPECNFIFTISLINDFGNPNSLFSECLRATYWNFYFTTTLAKRVLIYAEMRFDTAKMKMNEIKKLCLPKINIKHVIRNFFYVKS